MKKNIRSERGITLTVLVITVVAGIGIVTLKKRF